jgi:hypothetical protein
MGECKEILKLDYGFTKVLVLLCYWVQAKTCGYNASMKKDEFGFTLVNFKRLLSPRDQPNVSFTNKISLFYYYYSRDGMESCFT